MIFFFVQSFSPLAPFVIDYTVENVAKRFLRAQTSLRMRGRYVRVVYVTMTTEFSEPENSAAAEINFNLVLSNTVTHVSVVSETWYVPLNPRHPDVHVSVRSPGIVPFLPHHSTNAIFRNFNNRAVYVFT